MIWPIPMSEDNDNVNLGTEVELSPGLFPEEKIDGNITINTAGYVGEPHDHEDIRASLADLHKKVDHLLEHAHQKYEVNPIKE
tara:strand:- start:8527 stop:8775 length:249 start_codon:yes stop_codon:yes gene_type:complete